MNAVFLHSRSSRLSPRGTVLTDPRRSVSVTSRTVRMTAFLAMVVVALTALFAVPARADDVTRIPNFDVTAHLDDDGTLAVRFDVTADFPDERHGIFFVLPTAQR